MTPHTNHHSHVHAPMPVRASVFDLQTPVFWPVWKRLAAVAVPVISLWGAVAWALN